MSSGNAKWQQQYRERAHQEGMYKLQTWLSPDIAAQLEKICQREGITKREAVQRAIQQQYIQGEERYRTKQPALQALVFGRKFR